MAPGEAKGPAFPSPKRYQGTIGEFIGDAILVLFGAQLIEEFIERGVFARPGA
jgi:hypothetical protein